MRPGNVAIEQGVHHLAATQRHSWHIPASHQFAVRLLSKMYSTCRGENSQTEALVISYQSLLKMYHDVAFTSLMYLEMVINGDCPVRKLLVYQRISSHHGIQHVTSSIFQHQLSFEDVKPMLSSSTFFS